MELDVVDEPTFNPSSAVGPDSPTFRSPFRRQTNSVAIKNLRNTEVITKEQLMNVKMPLPKKIVTPTANPYMCGYFLKTVRNQQRENKLWRQDNLETLNEKKLNKQLFPLIDTDSLDQPIGSLF